MRKREYDNLERDVIMARKLGYGCHCGHYKADHPQTRMEEQEEILMPGEPPRKSAEQLNRTAICPSCGKAFVKTHHSRIYCSGACIKSCGRKRARERAERIAAENRKEKTCAVCGKPFFHDRKRHLYCSDECSAEGARRATENRKAALRRQNNDAHDGEIA